MDNDKNVSAEKTCGSECACNKKSGLSPRIRLLFLIIIVVIAGAVLANSIKKKSTIANTTAQSGYTVKAPPASATIPASSSSETKSTYTSTAKSALQNGTFVRLAAFSSLDTLANGFDGIFVLLVNKEEEKTASVTSAIDSAITAIGSRNIKIGLFQLAGTSPDFSDVAAQMPPPCVLVLVKGKGMRGVRGNDISTTKLLQAYTGAMQPSGCCPSGSAGGCK